MMPLTLTLVRHGESEANFIKRYREQRGVPHPSESAILRTHTSEVRLTTGGKQQALCAGVWLRQWMTKQMVYHPREFGEGFRYYTSPYVRAMETALMLELGKITDVRWHKDPRLCERNWGSEFDSLSYEERLSRFGPLLEKKNAHAYFWRPGDGETLQDVFLRLRDFISSLHRNNPNQHVLLVTHGEVMQVWRMILEHGDHLDLRRHMTEHDPQTHIRNCRIIQYTRLDSEGREADNFCRFRFVNPENPSDPKTNRDWAPLVRHLPSDQDLLNEVDRYPYLVEAEVI